MRTMCMNGYMHDKFAWTKEIKNNWLFNTIMSGFIDIHKNEYYG